MTSSLAFRKKLADAPPPRIKKVGSVLFLQMRKLELGGKVMNSKPGGKWQTQKWNSSFLPP